VSRSEIAANAAPAFLAPTFLAPTFLAVACVSAFATGTADAAEPAPTPDPAAAPGDADSIMVNGQWKPVQLSSGKATASLLDTPQTVTVISNQTLQKQNLLTLRDALSTLPGITFGAGEGGGGYGDSINLRGYSANNDITIDGVRDSAQYSRTETFNIEQIEVYNGANSVFNGSGSVGGTINLAQKLPKKGDLTVLGAAIGTDNYYRATVDSNRMLTDTIAARLNAVYHRNDVPGRDVEQYKRWGIAPSITIGVGTPTRLTFMYVHQHDNNVPQYGVPYFPQVGGLPAGMSYHDYFGYKNIDTQKSTVDQGTMIFEHDFSDHVSIRNLTRYENIRQLTIVDPPQGTYNIGGQCLSGTITATNAAGNCVVNVAASAPNGAYTVVVPNGYYLASGPRGNVRDTRNELGYDQLDLRANFETSGIEHNLVAGTALTWEKFTLHTGREFRNANGSDPFGTKGLPLINIADPSQTIVGPSTGVYAGNIYGNNVYTGPINYIRGTDQTGTRSDYAVYLFDTAKIGKMFEVNFGLRWERNIMDSHSIGYSLATSTLGAVTSNVPQHNAGNLFSYRGGLVFKPAENVSLYAAYGNSKTPSISAVNGSCFSGSGATFVTFCDVKPEKAKNYEIGAKADVLNRRLQLTAAVFRNERSNFKVASNDPSIGNVALQIPDGRSRVDGLALGATGNITKALTLFANYTYLKSKVLQGVSAFCVANPLTADCKTAIAAAPEAGGPLQQTPKHSGSLLTSYTLPFGLQLGYGLTYQGKFAIVTNPSAKINGAYPMSRDYLLHRIFASYEVIEGLTAQLNVQNLTNKHYYTSIRNNGWAVPGATRSATMSLFYSF
jgi:catecholate siderophore receptor